MSTAVHDGRHPLRLAAAMLLSAAIAGAQVNCRPNVFGGQDCRVPDGRSVHSRPNVFGGNDCSEDDSMPRLLDE